MPISFQLLALIFPPDMLPLVHRYRNIFMELNNMKTENVPMGWLSWQTTMPGNFEAGLAAQADKLHF
jgi:hypothetical protein